MSKKNLDNLFQEKFKNFEQVPDEKVWKSIEASLDNNKKDRKIIPIWWRLGGVAALLAILFYIINPFEGENSSVEPVITDVENTVVPENVEKSNSAKDLGVPNLVDEEQVVTTGEIDSNSSNLNGNSMSSTSISGKNSQITSVNAAKNESNLKTLSKNTDNYNFQSNTENEAVAVLNKVDDSKDEIHDVINKKENELEKNLLNTENEEAIALVDEKKEDVLEETLKKSIFDEIEETNKEDEVVENNSKKWSVGPSIAPVYYNGIGNGSPIDSDFTSNSKSGDVNLSFGINVSYDISKKLSLRSGIHRADYGYSTNDIAFSSTLNGSADIDNIDYSKSSRNIVVESSSKPQAFANDETSAADASLDGNMLQQFGYLEMPLELNYALIDKKIGVNLIGGVSSMLLINNNVILESDGLATEIGEANNINPINFSTNFGFGINYKLTPQTQLNVEPMFKYHLNTFSEASGNFQPYSIGVYSGIKFKF